MGMKIQKGEENKSAKYLGNKINAISLYQFINCQIQPENVHEVVTINISLLNMLQRFISQDMY